MGNMNLGPGSTAMDTLIPSIPILIVVAIGMIGMIWITNSTGSHMDAATDQMADIAGSQASMLGNWSEDKTVISEPFDSSLSCSIRGDGSRSCEPRDSMNITNWLPVLAVTIKGGLAIYFVLSMIKEEPEKVK